MVLSAFLVLAGSFGELEVRPLFDFAEPGTAEAWSPVHDVVMGGRSSGSAKAVDGAVRFEGRMSLENNGGFASFRAQVEMPDLSESLGLRLRVKGDGQVYKLTLRTDGRWDGVSWRAPFATRADEWMTVDLAFEELMPGWRGRLVTEAPAFDASKIEQIGFQISDKQAGEFALELASIEAWKPKQVELAPEGSWLAWSERSGMLGQAVQRKVSAADLLDQMQWNERVIVVAAPSDLDAEASKQMGHLLAQSSSLAARELRIVNLMGSRTGRLAGRTLTRDQVRGLRTHWELPVDEWSVTLVGKDGDVKQSWSSLVEPGVLLEMIDAMPMRRNEVEQRGKAKREL